MYVKKLGKQFQWLSFKCNFPNTNNKTKMKSMTLTSCAVSSGARYTVVTIALVSAERRGKTRDAVSLQLTPLTAYHTQAQPNQTNHYHQTRANNLTVNSNFLCSLPLTSQLGMSRLDCDLWSFLALYYDFSL